jgi:hypothetical protein
MPPFFVQVGMEKIFLPPFNKNIISQSKVPGPKFEGRRNAGACGVVFIFCDTFQSGL